MQTSTVGIREAKIQLSKLLKLVQQGNEVILTDRGKPVGKIVPIAAEELPLSARLKQMEEKGLVQELPIDYYRKVPSPIPIAENLAQQFLNEDRDK
jgi:prevent-host-death family protein